MKKTILTLMFIAGAMTLKAQTTKKLAKSNYFTVSENITNADTLVYYYFSFQNMKYSHITDLGSILLYQKEQITEMANKLIELTNIEEKISVNFQKKEYSLNLYDFSSNIFLSDSKGKYTSITKKQAINLSQDLLKYINLLKQ
jgi:hypothetical protein